MEITLHGLAFRESIFKYITCICLTYIVELSVQARTVEANIYNLDF